MPLVAEVLRGDLMMPELSTTPVLVRTSTPNLAPVIEAEAKFVTEPPSFNTTPAPLAVLLSVTEPRLDSVPATSSILTPYWPPVIDAEAALVTYPPAAR